MDQVPSNCNGTYRLQQAVRDGKNTPIWNRRKPGGGGYQVMAGKIGGTPGEESP